MNKTKLKVLADAIEAAPDNTFDMEGWFMDLNSDALDLKFVAGGINAHCGTAGCIAGWTCNIFLPPGEEIEDDDIEAKAMELLEVEGATGEWSPYLDHTAEEEMFDGLFTRTDYWKIHGYHVRSLADVTKEMAVRELRRLASA